MVTTGNPTIFLGGDVMLGRGIDQVLPNPGSPALFEPYVRDAREYIALAEAVHGRIPRPVEFAYPWGDALAAMEQATVRIVNLETSITRSDDAWPKGINYRMHPKNAPCLSAGGIDCCVLANNHVLDWGHRGLAETLDQLRTVGITAAGAGKDIVEADAPAILPLGDGRRLLVFAACTEDSGVPPEWGAGPEQSGVHLLPDLGARTVDTIAQQVRGMKGAADFALFSVHWGGNWGYAIPEAQRAFARALIDKAGIDAIHGHSSHHIKGVEFHRGKLVIYGAGDLINDYEGIGGYELFRGDLALLYLVTLLADGACECQLVPVERHRFQLRYAAPDDAQWLCDRLNREGAALGTRAALLPSGRIQLLASA